MNILICTWCTIITYIFQTRDSLVELYFKSSINLSVMLRLFNIGNVNTARLRQKRTIQLKEQILDPAEIDSSVSSRQLVST